MSCCSGSKQTSTVSNTSTQSNNLTICYENEDNGASITTVSSKSCCKSSITSTTTTNDSCCQSKSNITNKNESSSCCKSEKVKEKESDSCCKSGSCSDSKTSNNKINENLIVSSDATEIKDDKVTTFSGCPSDSPQAGKEEVCNGCPGQSACQSHNATTTDETKSIEIRMRPIRHKILVMSGKGGVGKSTISSLLAYALASKGQKVSILDVDLCGPSIPLLMGVSDQQIINSDYGWVPPKSPGHEIKVMSVGSLLNSPDSPVIWRGPRKTNMIRSLLKDTFWGKQDYLIIDTPPGTSDEHLSIISALKSCKPDGAILVTSPQDLAIDIVKKEISLCLKLKFTILGIIENLSGYVCPCCNETTEIFKPSSKGGTEELCKEFNIPFLGKIPIDTNLAMCADKGICSICEFSTTQGSLSILNILDKIIK